MRMRALLHKKRGLFFVMFASLHRCAAKRIIKLLKSETFFRQEDRERGKQRQLCFLRSFCVLNWRIENQKEERPPHAGAARRSAGRR